MIWSSFKMWAAHLYLRGPYFCPPSGTGTRVFQTNAPSGHSSAPLRETFGFTLFRSAQHQPARCARTGPVLVLLARIRSHKSGRCWRNAQKTTSLATLGTSPGLVLFGSLRSHQSQATAPFGASATNNKTQLGTRKTSATSPGLNDNSVAALRTKA